MVDIELRDDNGQVVEKATGEAQWDYWHSVLESTEDWLKNHHWNGWSKWRASNEFARGKQWAFEDDDGDADSANLSGTITVNKVGSFIHDLIPFLIKREPRFLGKPRRPQDLESAKTQGDLVTYHWHVGQMNRQLKLCALDFLTIGHCVGKTGYTRELDEAKARTQKGQTAAPEGLEYRDYIKREMPFFHRVNPFRFLIDPAAPSHDLASARWVAEIIFRPYQDVCEDVRYDKRAIKEMKEGQPSTVRTWENEKGLSEVEVSPKESQQEIDTKHDFLVLYEVWDKRSRKNFVFARGVNRPLLERDWPFPHLQGFPYEMAKFEEVSNELYGVGIPHSVADLQKMLNRLRSRQFAMARAYSPQLYGPQLDPDEERKLRSKDPDEYISMDETMVSHDIRAVPHPILPADFYQAEASIQQDFRELTSMDALIQGGPLPARTSATEVRTRQQLFGLKLEDAVQSMDQFVLNIGKQLLAHSKAFMVQEAWVQQLGRAGGNFVKITPEQIKIEADIDLISTSKQPTDPQTERQQAMQLLGVVSQALPALMQVHGMQAQAIQQGFLPPPGMVDIAQLMYYIAEKFEIDEIDRIFPALSMAPEAGEIFAQYEGIRPNAVQRPGQTPPGDPNAQPGQSPQQQQVASEAQQGQTASSFSNAFGAGSIPAPGEVV